jgi:hypothetical protein
MSVMANAAAPTTIQPRQYLLRGLLWCRPCQEQMVPTRAANRTRSYICLHWQCPCTPVPALAVERRVWDRYVRLNERAALAVNPWGRHAALVSVLRRVVVGADVDDLAYVWRD